MRPMFFPGYLHVILRQGASTLIVLRTWSMHTHSTRKEDTPVAVMKYAGYLGLPIHSGVIIIVEDNPLLLSSTLV